MVEKRAGGSGVRNSRHALCIGIDAYGPEALQGCVADAQSFSETLARWGFKVRKLTNEQATRQAIAAGIDRVLSLCEHGGIVAIQYAGHGTQLPDTNNDESDGLDEAWVPYDYNDGEFVIDDDIGALFDRHKGRGIELVVFTDCCHSGTSTRFWPGRRATQTATHSRYLPVPPDVVNRYLGKRKGGRSAARSTASDRPGWEIHFAACQDQQSAYEHDGHGDFTRAATKALAGALATPTTYGSLAEKVSAAFFENAQQTPVLRALPELSALPLFGSAQTGAARPSAGSSRVRRRRDRRSDPGESASIDWVESERVVLPAQVAPVLPKPDWPAARPLRIYASDPSNIGLRQPILRVEVPYEELKAGPVGKMFAVVIERPPKRLLKLLGWSDELVENFAMKPLNLDELRVTLGEGLTPSTGDPQFAAQMAYAVCQQVYGVFRQALGRNPTWGPWAKRRLDAGDSAELRLRPFALEEANAWYDPEKGTLEFGYFTADADTPSPYVLPGGLVVVALSRDIIAHELAHAILDGMRAEFMRDTNLDVAAFHEGFADLIALFTHFSQEELVEQAIEDSRGGLNSDLLFDLAKQFGEAVNGKEGGALRRALYRKEGLASGAEVLQYANDKPSEEHDRGSILVAAVFEAFLTVYQRRTKRLFRVAQATGARRGTQLSAELVQLLSEQARKVAGHFLRICIRAIDYCPPVDIRFGSYLRSLITADYEAVPDDEYGYRDALIKAFRRRNIEIRNVRDLSEESLRWKPPEEDVDAIKALSFEELQFTDNGLNQPAEAEIKRRAAALGEFITKDPARLRVFGLREPRGPYGKIVIQSIRLAHRSAPDGIARNELVAEVTQTRKEGANSFVGGATILIGMDGKIRYLIRRRVDDEGRRRSEIAYAGRSGADRLDLRAIHGRRHRRTSKRTSRSHA